MFDKSKPAAIAAATRFWVTKKVAFEKAGTNGIKKDKRGVQVE